ncbi:MAG: hypothetical protein ACPHJD_00415 [Poseidonia sp.]|jgi:hypothetical protein
MIFMLLMETIVCSAKEGVEARMMRMLKTRQEFKRRQIGCVAAWLGAAPDNSNLVLVQTVFDSASSWKSISERVQMTLDAEDGGIESLLLGPPLVGMFQVDPNDLNSLVK